jgi:radical SAM-linked protein
VRNRTADEPASAPEEPRPRYRARFSKTGRIRFLGHLDLTRTLLRAMRRAGVRFAYSQGFNPKPRVAFGPALSVGISSEGEYVDFETLEPLDAEHALDRINASLPRGIRFATIREIRRDVPQLTAALRAARYRVETGNGFDLAETLADFRARGPVEVVREKEGKVTRLPLQEFLLDLTRIDAQAIRLTLSAGGNRGSVRPEEVLRAIFGERAETMRTVREDVLVEWRGRLVNPLLAATAAASDAERADP